MGGSQDKGKNSFNLNTSNKHDKEEQRAKKVARTALITVTVVAILFAGALLLNSNYLRQHWACVKIGDVKYSITDFNYNYQNLYAQYYSSMSGSGSDFTSAMLPEQGKSLKSQIYDQETGETWADFFTKMTLAQLKEDNKVLVEALDAGYELTEDDYTSIDQEVENVLSTGYTYGYTDLDSYLKALYGKGMDEKAFRSALERAYLINSYTNHVNDSFTYTTDEIETYYGENSGKLDTFTYRYFHISAGDFNKADYADDAAYDAAKEEGVDESEKLAKTYAEGITSEADIIDAARDYDPEAYAEDDATKRIYQGELLGGTYGDWLRDEARVEGDVSTFRSTNGTYVVYYIRRSDNHYNTADVRTILCPPEEIDPADYAEDETTVEYDTAVEAARQAAEDTANDIYNTVKTADNAETAFEEQTEFYTGTSQIDPENTGLFEQVFNGQMPDEVNSWIFDDARQAGDYTMVYSPDKGYYLVYYVDSAELYSTVLADKKLRQRDLQEWKDSLEVVEPQTTWLMTLAQ